MTLDFEVIKQLTRLQGAVEGVLDSIRTVKAGGRPLSAASNQLDALIGRVRDVLAAADPQLASEFDNVVTRANRTMWGADASASALLGWLKGLSAAEEIEAQRSANAEAYAEAKLREERSVGFSAGDQRSG